MHFVNSFLKSIANKHTQYFHYNWPNCNASTSTTTWGHLSLVPLPWLLFTIAYQALFHHSIFCRTLWLVYKVTLQFQLTIHYNCVGYLPSFFTVDSTSKAVIYSKVYSSHLQLLVCQLNCLPNISDLWPHIMFHPTLFLHLLILLIHSSFDGYLPPPLLTYGDFINYSVG